MNQTTIERLRALEKKWRDTADQCEERGLEADSVGLTVAANKADARADELRGCADELATLIAELGQEVGAVPSFRGYANLGVGAYLLEHSAEGEDAELCIVPATEAEKAGRTVGDLRHFEGERQPIPAEKMTVRIGFANVAGLDALEQQLRILREVHFPASPAHTSEARDAERYRWLRKAHGSNVHGMWHVRQYDNGIIGQQPEELDAAIDAAMRQEAGKKLPWPSGDTEDDEDANREPCPCCFIRSCNGECGGDGHD